MEMFNIMELSEFAAMQNLDPDVEISSAWEATKENTNI
jgi:hypothetical protein